MALNLEKALLSIAKEANELRAEEVRKELDPRSYIEAIHEILKSSGEAEPDLNLLKFQSDIYFALLKKCLPDLKALELSGNVKHNMHEDWLELLNDK